MQWFPDRYLPHCVERLIALESGTLVLSDVGELWDTPVRSRMISKLLHIFSKQAMIMFYQQ